ncbi:hypothetical protein KR054_012070, partial [Drosophila jambulina]
LSAFCSWHVRTKDNIARVRRDQAAAAAEEKIRQDKLELAVRINKELVYISLFMTISSLQESEARINFLRRQSGLPEKVSAPEKDDANSEQTKGVDLFADYRSHVKTTNKDLEKEQKEEQEKYEKQIGYLTYLGQDTNEALKVRSWYEVAPKRSDVGNSSAAESHLKQKVAHDPLTLINALLPPAKKDSKSKIKRARTLSHQSSPPATCTLASSSHKSKKHKKDKKRTKSSDGKVKKHKTSSRVSEAEEQAERYKREKLERLRKERLRREAAERQRSEALFAPKEAAVAPSATSTPAPTPRIVQKYNSQFNPELAKQNML